jgi:hypothetical protein
VRSPPVIASAKWWQDVLAQTNVARIGGVGSSSL